MGPLNGPKIWKTFNIFIISSYILGIIFPQVYVLDYQWNIHKSTFILLSISLTDQFFIKLQNCLYKIFPFPSSFFKLFFSKKKKKIKTWSESSESCTESKACQKAVKRSAKRFRRDQFRCLFIYCQSQTNLRLSGTLPRNPIFLILFSLSNNFNPRQLSDSQKYSNNFVRTFKHLNLT